MNAQSWSQTLSGTNRRFTALHFPTDSIGYAVGEFGTIRKSIDGGNIWLNLTSNYPNYMFHDVHFVDTLTGFVVADEIPNSLGGPATVLKTTNGGVNWSVIYSDSTHTSTELFVLGRDTIFVIGHSKSLLGTAAKIIKSVDGGIVWHQIGPNFPDSYMSGVHFINGSRGFAGIFEQGGGTSFPFAASTIEINDTNVVLTPIVYSYNFPFYNRHSIDFPTPARGYSIVSSGFDSIYLRKTMDSGNTWTTTFIPNFIGGIYDIEFLNSNEGYFIGGETLLYTHDGCNTWSVQNLGVGHGINAVQFLNSNLGFGIGENGKIYKYTGAPNGVSKKVTENKISIYPNPCISRFSIKDIQGLINVEIINNQGQIIRTFEKTLNRSFETQTLLSGMYTIQISKGNKIIGFIPLLKE